MIESKANVCVRSDKLSEGELKNIRNDVNSWIEKGYSKMAIHYFLGQRYTAIGTTEGKMFVITLS